MSKLTVKSAGYSIQGDLHFHPGPSTCGDITDGVVFEHDNEGGWLISFASLEALYLAAKAAREPQNGEANGR